MSDQISPMPALLACLPIQSLASIAASTNALATKAAAPLAAHATATSAEVAAFVSRRNAAWLAHGSTLAKCHQPAEWMSASQAFWRQASADYAETSQKMFASWNKAFQVLQHVAPLSANGAITPSAARDFITFKEPEQQTQPDMPPARSKTDNRRAAA